MCTPKTENTLTVDADVFGYYFRFTRHNKSLPQGLTVCCMPDFCEKIIEKYPIAINDFIKTEYGDLVGHEFVKNWVSIRLQNNLAINVALRNFDQSIKKALIQEYGFDYFSKDCKYLKTAFNTISKRLITGNKNHFQRPHKSNKKRLNLPSFLHSNCTILIHSIDQSCVSLLE